MQNTWHAYNKLILHKKQPVIKDFKTGGRVGFKIYILK